MRTASSALVVASGAPLRAVERAPQTDLVIAADAGLEVLLAAGRSVDLVVGDLDSVSQQALSDAAAGGAEIQQHRRDKDESDLELALTAAIWSGAQRVAVLLRDGGRLDHQLANLLVLASPRWRQAVIDAVVGEHRVWVVHGGDERTIPLVAGEALALHAVGATAQGVTTTKLRYPLAGGDLPSLVALGISNEAVADAPTIRVESGVVLVISSSKPSSGGSAARQRGADRNRN
ncbi:MAG: thiamine diphosphokinase [Acidimicrobiaceae bacterium]|nr:thiamine diphosphokinase [Acidimicrobiia bacterium]MCY4493999.1 thiamine diphosphokinase [Acidimicrobiaceae bacterium]